MAWFDRNNDDSTNADPFGRDSQETGIPKPEGVDADAPDARPQTDAQEPEDTTPDTAQETEPEEDTTDDTEENTEESEPEKPKPKHKASRSTRRQAHAEKKGLSKAEINEAIHLLDIVRGPARPAIQTLVNRASEKEDDAALAAALSSGRLAGAMQLAKETKEADGETAKVVTLYAAASGEHKQDFKLLASLLNALTDGQVNPKAKDIQLIGQIIQHIDALPEDLA